jgi:hypothetical protein
MATTTTTYTRDDIGCYFDGARGWADIGEAVQQMAVDHYVMVQGQRSTASEESFNDSIDYAENALNGLTADDVKFGSSEQGDWGLWPICEHDWDWQCVCS